MSKQLLKIVLVPLLIAGALPLAAQADPPPWAPAHGYRAKQYRYVYYPRYDVYYAPERQAWFWLDGGRWRVGASLPSGLVVAGVPGVSISLGSARPYEYNEYVIEHYGYRVHRHHHDDDDDDDDD